jgi:hypothetical protein
MHHRNNQLQQQLEKKGGYETGVRGEKGRRGVHADHHSFLVNFKLADDQGNILTPVIGALVVLFKGVQTK